MTLKKCKRVNQIDLQVFKRILRDMPHVNIPSLPLNTYYWAVITTLTLQAKWSTLESPSAIGKLKS